MTERQIGWWWGWGIGMILSFVSGLSGGEWAAAHGMGAAGATMAVMLLCSWRNGLP